MTPPPRHLTSPRQAFVRWTVAGVAASFVLATVAQAYYMLTSDAFNTPPTHPPGWSVLWEAPVLALAGMLTYFLPFALAGSLCVGGIGAAWTAWRRRGRPSD